jgi:hypothetical protein
MLFWITKITVISIILILLVHHLINFFKSTLTIPKIKDLVNTSSKSYENIYNVIEKERMNKPLTAKEDYTSLDLLPTDYDEPSKQTYTKLTTKEETSMKNELKNFLKKQLHEGGSQNNVYGESITKIGDNNYLSL